MDHFNATIKDGKLVSTRRGLQVSRQKFNGTSFVNSCPQTTTPKCSPKGTGSANSKTLPLRFVRKDNEPHQAAARAQRQGPQGSQHSFVLEVPQNTKSRRRGSSRSRSPKMVSTPSSDSSSRASSQVPSPRRSYFQLPPLESHDFFGQTGFPIESPMPRIVPTTAPNRPSGVSEEDWQMFHHYFPYILRRLYPYEDILTHNPARASEFYYYAVNDSTALHCALMSGSILDAILRRSDSDPKGYAYYISKICSILTQKLGYNKDADPITLCCIATLAANGCYVGRLDHWHTHMQGLQRVLETQRIESTPACLHAKMHKADLQGAVSLCTNPYLTFTRRYPDVSLFLSHDTRSYTTRTLTTILSPLGVTPPVITALSSLALFASAVRVARQSNGTVTFDPDALTDEYLAVMHALVTWPGPLRDSSERNPFVSNGEGKKSEADKYMANHRLRDDVEVTPPAGEAGVESALRIAALLYLKELLPDWPRNLGGYGVLIKLLGLNLEAVLDGMVVEDEDEMIVGLRLSSRRRRGSGASSSLGRERVDSLRSVLVFLALVGGLMAGVADENEGREGEERYERGIYTRCLREGLGFVGGDDVVEEDLAIVRLFDLRNLKGEGWDVRDAVGDLLMG
ncbi:hypothetical protein OQA88_135 [Cercophora sp. LCS_1]